MKYMTIICAIVLSGFVAETVYAGGRFHGGGTAITEQGAVSGRGAVVRGPNGGGAVHGGGAAVDSQGNLVSGRGGAATIKDSSGNIKLQGARAGKTTGTIGSGLHHESGMAVQSAKGTVKSNGTLTTDGAGGVSGARNTLVQSSTSNASYQGSTTYQKGVGATHTGTCTDASGATVSCSKP